MKTLLTTISLALALSLSAQNKNVQNETKTTVTTIKDSEGEKQVVKKENIQQQQDIEFQNPDGKSLNKRTVETPVEVTSSTQITNPDGSTRTVDVDRSAIYTYNGQTYKVDLDSYGYTVSSSVFKKPALLRKTSTNAYIYRNNGMTSIGYFDREGNLVLETYDDKTDQVSVQKFVRSGN